VHFTQPGKEIKMKRIALSSLMVFAIALTACSTPLADILTGTLQTSNKLPTETQLAVGTLKLEGTEQGVTAQQAQELLVLWQVYEEISQSSTTAQEEIDGLIEQIQENMTSEQVQAISDMQLTQQDVSAAAQGSTVTQGSSQSNSTASSVTPPDGGGMVGGAPPDGGGMPADFGGAEPTVSTSQADSAQTSLSADSSAGVPSAVVEAVIRSLQQKIAM
jgi:hypothetical protein